MDIEELVNKLQDFKQTCFNKGYIYDELTFDEAYPDIIPTSFVVNVIIKESWSYFPLSKALDKLIEILWKTTDPKTLESIFTLSLYTIDELVNSEKKRDREQIAINPDLIEEQIKKLRVDKEDSVSNRVIIKHIKTNEITKEELYRIFDMDDNEINSLLKKRYSEDEEFQALMKSTHELRTKIIPIII